MRSLINVALFYVAWLACILGAAHGHHWLGVGIATAVVVLHLTLIKPGRREAMVLALSGFVGLVLDAVVLQLGRVQFPGAERDALLAPVWMAALWVAFATLLSDSLAWLRGRYKLAQLFGALGGPLSYYGGAKLGAIQLIEPIRNSLIVIALEWWLAMPVLLKISETLHPTSKLEAAA